MTVRAALLLCLVCVSACAEWVALGEFETTAYCSCVRCCGSKAQGITASGTRARLGVVATDRSVVPLYSVLKLEGVRDLRFLAEDTGSAIKGRRLDIWMPTHEEALLWGRKTLTVWIWRTTQ